jgi:outer membrane cobalamin receptor
MLGLITLMSSACANANHRRAVQHRDRASSTLVFTADQIKESGATTAWQAIQRLAPHMRAAEANGKPSRLQRRGPASMYLNDAPLVFLDGVRLQDFKQLDLLPAAHLETISILSLADGATYYGTNAVGGVILLRSKLL